jgi:hypothetical protein
MNEQSLAARGHTTTGCELHIGIRLAGFTTRRKVGTARGLAESTPVRVRLARWSRSPRVCTCARPLELCLRLGQNDKLPPVGVGKDE